MRGGLYAFCEAAMKDKTCQQVRCRVGETASRTRIVAPDGRIDVSKEDSAGALELRIISVLNDAGWGSDGLWAMRVEGFTEKGKSIAGLTHSENRKPPKGSEAAKRADPERQDFVHVLTGTVEMLSNSLNENCRIMRVNSLTLVQHYQQQSNALALENDGLRAQLKLALQQGGNGKDQEDDDDIDPEMKRRGWELLSRVGGKLTGVDMPGDTSGLPTVDDLVALADANPHYVLSIMDDPRLDAAMKRAFAKMAAAEAAKAEAASAAGTGPATGS